MKDYLVNEETLLKACKDCGLFTSKTKLRQILKSIPIKAENVELFNTLLYLVRAKLRHRGIMKIKSTDVAYTMVKEISNDATDFCKANNLTLSVGFKKYIKIGVKLMGKKYALNRFKTFKEKINNVYQNESLVVSDDTLMWNLIAYYITKAGIESKEYAETIVKNSLIDFKLLSNLLTDNKISKYKIYINAQFQYFKDTFDSIPQLNQLHTNKALERYYSYKIKTKLK